jgi:hypothetical protein
LAVAATVGLDLLQSGFTEWSLVAWLSRQSGLA